MNDRSKVIDFLAPLGVLFVLSLLIAATGLDLILERRFFVPGAGWIYGEMAPWKQLYKYGVFPSFVMAFGALMALVAGFACSHAYVYRKCALFFVLLMLLGPGVLVNSVLKDHWGRPRPRQMQVFGGDRSYHQIWERGEAGRGMSFPSGHASAAFYLMAPYFVLRGTSRKWSRLALAGGIGYGLLMGVARMAQGGHFPSDVLWAGGCVYLTGLVLYYLLGLDRGVLLSPKEEPVVVAVDSAE